MKNDDIQRLQGVWTIVALEMDGRRIAGSALNGAYITIERNEFTWSAMGVTHEGIIKVDATATPGALDLKFTSGPEKGNTNLGIYEFNGDNWRLCRSTRAATRPKAFAAEPNTGLVVEVLDRRKHAVAAPSLDTARFVPAPELEGEWSMISGFFDGHPLEDSFVRSARRFVDGIEMTVIFGKDVYSKANYTVDRSTTPAAIDIHNLAGMNAGKMRRGIYDVQGKTLVLSIAGVGRERPSDFSSSLGDGRTVVTWKKNG